MIAVVCIATCIYDVHVLSYCMLSPSNMYIVTRVVRVASLFHTFSAGAVVDFENITYVATEGDEVSVCAVITHPDSTCPVDFTFTINLSAGDGMR